MAIINGTTGNDSLTGTSGDDTISGYEGNDTLKGGSGNDTYNIYCYYQYTIQDDGGEDLLRLDDELSFDDADIFRSGNDLIISIEHTYNLTDRYCIIKILDQYLNDSYKIEQLEFPYAKFPYNFTLSTDDLIIGSTDQDTLNGTSGNDTIFGGAGDDTITGFEGNDIIKDTSGNDSYIFNLGDGKDTITDSSGNDTIILGENTSPNQVFFERSFDNLIIKYSSTDSITVDNYYIFDYDKDCYNNKIENIQFYDGTSISEFHDPIITISDIADYTPITKTVRAKSTYTLEEGYENLILTGDYIEKVKLPNGIRANIYGNPIVWGNYLDYYQGDNRRSSVNDCGIVSCENVLIQAGVLDLKPKYSPKPSVIDNEESSVYDTAWTISIYVRGHGGATQISDMVDTLNEYGVSAHAEISQTETGVTVTPETIAQYIKENRCVIACVDSQVLWGYRSYFYEIDHAIVVTGVAYNSNNPNQIEGFYICDSGNKKRVDKARFISYDLMNTILGGKIIVTDDPIKLCMGNINGTGNGLDNYITGNYGSNNIKGLAGNDTLDGGFGNDTLYGGAGDDTYYIDNKSDRVIEYSGQGNDSIISELSYTIAANCENLTLTGSNNINGTGNTINNLMAGNVGDNVLNGNKGNDTLIGDEGNDILIGGTGVDTMSGGTGNDTYYIDNIYDHINEEQGQGTDLCYSSVSYTLEDNVDNLVLTVRAINGTGNELINSIQGNKYNNILDGGSGSDTLVGGKGNDVYFIDDTGDVITEYNGQGIDTVKTSIDYTLGDYLENLTLIDTDNINGTGNSYNNTITGNSGDNTLDGQGGNDIINGGDGNDPLIGGSGNDTYVFDINGGSDTISDMSGNDRIYFNKGIAKTDVAIFRQGTDLIIDYGSSSGDSKITIQNQFNGSPIEKLQLSSGKYLSSTNINHIIQDIANYDTTHTELTITSIDAVKSNLALMNIIASHWHS